MSLDFFPRRCCWFGAWRGVNAHVFFVDFFVGALDRVKMLNPVFLENPHHLFADQMRMDFTACVIGFLVPRCVVSSCDLVFSVFRFTTEIEDWGRVVFKIENLHP